MSSPTLHLPRRAMLAAALGATLLPSLGNAQFLRRDQHGRIPRAQILPFVGIAVAGAVSSIAYVQKPRSLKSACSSATCIAGTSMAAGGFVGWLVGREKDELHALRYRGGRPLYPSTHSVTLSGDPLAIAADGRIVAAGGLGGVHVVSSNERRATRAAGLRGIADVAVSENEQLLGLVASGGAYRFPLMDGQGLLLRGGTGGSAIVASGNEFLVAVGHRVERIPRGAEDAKPSWPGVAVPDTIRAIRLDGRGTAWGVSTESLFAMANEGDSLRIVSTTPLPRGARRLAIDGNTLAVALGDSGLALFDIADPAAPGRGAHWTGTRFAYDVALAGDRAFIAAGIDGMALVSLAGPTPQLVGLARDLGFIVSVAVAGDNVWVLDRSGTATLRRMNKDIR